MMQSGGGAWGVRKYLFRATINCLLVATCCEVNERKVGEVYLDTARLARGEDSKIVDLY